MTVESQVRDAASAGNGLTTSFPCPFQFILPDDLIVLLTVDATGLAVQLALGTDYTIQGDSGAGQASVVLMIPPPAGTTVTRRRVTELVQPFSYDPNDGFPAASHETALDRQTLAAQEARSDIADVAARSPLLPANPTQAALLAGMVPIVGDDGAFTFAPPATGFITGGQFAA